MNLKLLDIIDIPSFLVQEMYESFVRQNNLLKACKYHLTIINLNHN